MKFLAKLAIAVIVNAIALLAAAYIVKGFDLQTDITNLAILAAVLTALNFFLKPLLKLVLGPVIVLTLGFGLILVNMIILYILDALSKNLAIENISALVYSSLIVGFVNFIFHMATKE